MHATHEQRHLASSQSEGADHAPAGATQRRAYSSERAIGLEEVLAMRVGCWRPPVYVPVPALAS